MGQEIISRKEADEDKIVNNSFNVELEFCGWFHDAHVKL